MSRDTTPIDFDDFFDPFESSSFIQPPNPLQPKGKHLKNRVLRDLSKQALNWPLILVS